MGWGDAIAHTMRAFVEVFGWKTGGRTQDENSLRARMDAAQKEHDAAIDSGDAMRISRARHRQLDLVREAQAKRP